jgi:prophage tail gpP-like protein
MPTPQDFNGIRGRQDRVVLTLAGEEALLTENYQVKSGIMTQPAAFSLRLGWGDGTRDLMKKYPPNTPFRLSINNTVVQTGFTDGYSAPTGAPSFLSLEGRDRLAILHDAFAKQEVSFKEDAYGAIVRKVLDAAGLKESGLAFSNEKNRLAITGGKGTQFKAARDVENEKIDTASGGAVKKRVQSQLGERYYEFLKRHLDRAGLFLWTAGDGSFVLSEPNPNQNPMYLIYRSWSEPERSNVIDSTYDNKTVGRFTECSVYTRGETKKRGRSKAIATIEDKEMKAWGFNRPMVIRDADCDTPKKAEFMARRKMAESRRAGWKLSYTVMGHTTIAIQGGTVTWAPDTVVEVQDQKLGLSGVYWVESVTFNGAPQATTTIELMRPDDLIYGSDAT